MKRTFLLLFSLFIIFNNPGYAQTVLINEFMASNSMTISDEDGDYPDWIELLNTGNTTIHLDGYGLSDDENDPYRWVFPDVNIGPGEFLLIWASGKDRRIPGSPLHTNFSIRASGEELLLSNADSVLLDFVPPVFVDTDISYGRHPDVASDWFYFSEPTPGFPNLTEGVKGFITDLHFSKDGGFYTDGFELEITTSVDGASIYYTLDGSLPDENGLLYDGPITVSSLEGTPNTLSMIPTNNIHDAGPPYYEGWQPPLGEVFKTHIIRAIAKKDQYKSSSITTQNYLIDERGADRYGLPVFFLNTDADNFFDPDIGIYFPGRFNNMYQRGGDWERPVHLTLFEKDGTHAFSQDLGVRIHGGTTRSRPRKSLRFYAREDYGKEWLDFQLFPEKEVSQYQRFLLRNSGNDWDQSVIRDGFMQFLARDLNVETQYYRPAILFVNGEYWGVHNLRDRYDAPYLESHYGLDSDEVIIMENHSQYEYGNADGKEHYTNMLTYIEDHSMADQDHYAYITTQMDPESFADFQITHIYVRNTDWPGNNNNYWRRLVDYDPDAPPGLDGRWRWMILDTDFGFGLDFYYVTGVVEGPAHNTLALALDASQSNHHWPNPAWSTFLLRSLVENESFRHHFINRFADLLNTTFHEKNVVAVLDSIQEALFPEMQEHIDRWRRPVTMQEWLDDMQIMRDFGERRPGYMRTYLMDAFELEAAYEVNLQTDSPYMGQVRLNTIKPPLADTWTGTYFKGVPITFEAIPADGYRFSHWSGHHTGNEMLVELSPEGDIHLTAHFEPDQAYEGTLLYPAIAHELSDGPYIFDAWDENQPEGTFPKNMLFLQTAMTDPGLEDEMTHLYHIPEGEYHADDLDSEGYPYRLTGRTRLNGLNDQGISFINTGRDRDLGAAVLAIDSRGVENITVSWTGGTLIPNARVYAIRLQYMVGVDGSFKDVLFPNGQAVEYMRSDVAGHEHIIEPVVLPSEVNDQPYVQLRWKYYFTGERLDADHGRRDMLRLDNILVTATEIDDEDDSDPTSVTNRSGLETRIYPNPASETVYIEAPEIIREIGLINSMGQVVMTKKADDYHLELYVANLNRGLYIIQIRTDVGVIADRLLIY